MPPRQHQLPPRAEADLFGDIKAFDGLVASKEAFERMKKHLADNNVYGKDTKWILGRKLMIDPKTEKFTDADVPKANDMLFSEYRKGFDISEAV